MLHVQNNERILKALTEKDQKTYEGRITPDFSMETLKVIMSYSDMLQTLTDHRCHRKTLYPVKLLLTID